MHHDVLDLRAFYYRTPLGRSAQRVLQEALRGLWPDTRGLTVVGFGFAVPLLRPFLADAAPRPRADARPAGRHALARRRAQPLRPRRGDPLADRGRHRRPAHRRPRARDLRQPRGAPRRDLARPRPGRPRRLHRPRTAPGSGRAATSPPSASAGPTASASSRRLLRSHRLAPERHAAALYAPPSHRKFLLQTAHFWERLGRRFEPRVIAGALLVEASKQVYARPLLRLEDRRARPARRPRGPDPAQRRSPCRGHGRRALGSRRES